MHRCIYRHVIAMLSLCCLSADHMRAQVYATSQSDGANGICIGCWVQTATNAVDTGIYSTYGTMRLTVSALNAYVYQRLTFSKAATSGRNVTIILESANATLLNATALGGLQITSYKSGISNNDTKGSSSIAINLLSGSSTQYAITVPVSKPFDAIELKLNAGIASALTNLRVYSAFYIDVTLPVTLVSFSGYRSEEGVRLQWTTASEIDNDHFTIERSNDGNQFDAVGFVAGSGSTNHFTTYTYTDEKLVPGTYYYRLRQTDYDGQSELSPVIAIGEEHANAAPMTILGNPFHDRLRVSFDLPVPGLVEARLIDMQGQTISRSVAPCQRGNNIIGLNDLSELSAGQYILRLVCGDDVYTTRVLKSP